MSKRVVLKGHSGAQYKEAIAETALRPGHILELDASTQKAQKQALARGPLAVAIENHWFGGGLDDLYAIDDRVCYQVLQSGAEFQGLVGVSAAAIANGALVMVDTANPGCVISCAQAGVVGASESAFNRDRAIGVARAAVDNSANAATEVRIRIEVL